MTASTRMGQKDERFVPFFAVQAGFLLIPRAIRLPFRAERANWFPEAGSDRNRAAATRMERLNGDSRDEPE